MPKDSLAKDYQNNKERLENKVCERYQSLYKKEKKKKQQYDRERCKNLPKEEKQKLAEYKKIIIK